MFLSRFTRCVFALSIGAICAPAATLTFSLTCVLNGISSVGCVNNTVFGTVTLATTADPNQLTLTVDLVGTGQKFRDLMLNYNGSSTLISSADGQASLSSNAFSIPPYSGQFDVGHSGGQGWNGNDGYSTTLAGNNGLNLTDFQVPDSGANIFVALHIQNIGAQGGGNCTGNDNGTANCVPGQTGEGSLKIGGLPVQSGDPIDSPEPSTGLLALAGLGFVIFRKLRA